MTDKKTLTTAQVSALTSISMPTLKRYVKLYGSHLSETARQNKRGRRWTADDIEKVININRVSITRIGKDKINELLEQDDQDTEAPTQNLLTANQVLELAVSALSQVEDQRREINKLIRTAGWNRVDYIKFEKDYARKIKNIFMQLDKQNALLIKISIKLGYGNTRNPNWSWLKNGVAQFEEWFKSTYPLEYADAINPPSWLDSVSKYKPPEDDGDIADDDD